ncbi:S66 peptidase family protein [Dyadobacter psychrotolerans]|uniref:LD-carboxypeptidase n=1 Tax=Dyadobacter psychrotolerans TaxID=2541721 RepID=A0A4R5E0G1_9BACT|nr:LD-carboxypeptidase [Dyadobacter psychrotolerans]TDE18340.1 LD-carboxypeptidase [Dyadobacter psychrotolerans]
MPKIVIPPFLQAGDKIGIVAPASTIRYEDVVPGINLLKETWNLEVVEGKTLKSSFNQFSARDEDRLTDLQHMLDDSSIKAIIAARGGYGCSRIIDQLNFTKFKKSPKWIVGFSDLTAILSQLFNLGFASLHAPMVKSMMQPGAEEARDFLGKILFGELPEYALTSHPLNRPGSASGQLVGGNLCLFAHLIGSATEIDTTGKILFIEDVNEYLYNLDRMLIQLKRSGKLKKLAGLIVGQFSDMRDNSQPTFGKEANEIVQEHVSEFNYPVCFDFPVGHVSDNKPMVVGANAFLEVNNKGVKFGYTPK